MKKSVGICIGAANLSLVEMSGNGQGSLEVLNAFSRLHEGNTRLALAQAVEEMRGLGYEHIAITGRKVENFTGLPSISEPEATEKAFRFINKDNKEFNAIVSMGAELFVAYILDKQGNISGVRTHNKCASGTGEFFLQQLRRMNVPLSDALKLMHSDKIYRVSGRCSVFCKSDCTHALNKGEYIGNILAGLCEMMARKVTELLVNVPLNDIMLAGGVALNWRVVEFLKSHIANIVVPKEATYFEAVGAAAWAAENKVGGFRKQIFMPEWMPAKYKILSPLSCASSLVDFIKTDIKGSAEKADRCIIGLDVGSTTTKAIVLRESDNKILASVYLRTNGNPVEASRQCYASLSKSIEVPFEIIGLGVTGSGRQIAGLHALTEGIVNEIIAHAKASVFFDKEVDTIFEIGGQDAKYTYLVNGLPADYAMNEACSAGTGSFLEESCKETLGVEMQDIATYALKSASPPSFNDQCAAFISSDIKTACYAGLNKDDIIAGLVYSICVNYINRVKGNRAIGSKIFMQGGVCYNQAVPLAMASLLGKKIIVPPEPGLMGAFGVALEIKERFKNGLLKEKRFGLLELANRGVRYHKQFKCKGGKDKCDRGCGIARIEVEGKIHPFGGACNKYYNLRYEINYDESKLNLVKVRQENLFAAYNTPGPNLKASAKSVGINKSFLIHYLLPLYYHFFSGLGLRIILSNSVQDTGVEKKGAAFCYPAEIAHGLFQDLLEKKTDFIFLPQVSELKSKNTARVKKESQSTCVILQAEPYYFMSAFKELDKDKLLSPVIDFSKGYLSGQKVFLDIARKLGFRKKIAAQAFKNACNKQEEFVRETKRLGRQYLEELEKNPDKIAVVILGRSYNAFAAEANMAIPDKFASRGIMVMPFDCLSYEDEPDDRHMHWATGQMLYKASRFIKKHPRLFATFITNFSCGPDSFILGYVRQLMGKKPMLILEVDSHTADAGINTRIEAFLDIVESYRRAPKEKEEKHGFVPAECVSAKKRIWVLSSQGEKVNINNPRIKILIPPMGELGPQALSAVFTSAGINSQALPVSQASSLQYGRGNTSCKECLPLILSVGGLIKYLKENPQNGDILVYFMPANAGNCRFGQYHIFIKNLIMKNQMHDVAVWTIDAQNNYLGLGLKFNIKTLKAAIISDVMYDIKNALKVLAQDTKEALQVFYQEWQKIIHCLQANTVSLERQLEKTATVLGNIKLGYPLSEAKVVALMGEIYVRRDDFCCQAIIERLAQKGFLVKTAGVLEWLYYVDYLVRRGLVESRLDIQERIRFIIKNYVQNRYERRIKSILGKSGLCQNEMVEIEKILHYGRHLIDERLTGEPIVIIGSALKEIMHSVCGVINIGPFACLPTKITEAILNKSMNVKTKKDLTEKGKDWHVAEGIEELPFLSIETDGSPFPPIIEAKIEAFCLQAERLHQKMRFLHSSEKNQ